MEGKHVLFLTGRNSIFVFNNKKKHLVKYISKHIFEFMLVNEYIIFYNDK